MSSATTHVGIGCSVPKRGPGAACLALHQSDPLLFRDDRFQVLARHNEAGPPSTVGLPEERDQVGFERRLAVRIERQEGGMRRPVEIAEYLDSVLRRPVAEREHAGRVRDRRRAGKQFTNVSLGSPQEG